MAAHRRWLARGLKAGPMVDRYRIIPPRE